MKNKVRSPRTLNEPLISMPYVIDNRIQILVDVLEGLLHSDAVHALDGLS